MPLFPRAGNPFRPGAGKVPPAFGGRTAPLLTAKMMVDRLAVPADPVDLPVLRGVRGTGKTSLMAYVRQHAARAGAVTLHIEADAADETLAASCATLARDAAHLTETVPVRVARRLAALDIKGKVEFHPVSATDAGSHIEALLDDIATLAEEAGRGVLSALAARGGSGAIGELLNDIGLQRHDQLSAARATLLERGLLLAPSHGRLAFTVPGFDRWVLDNT